MTPGEIAGVVGAVLAVGALAERVATRISAPPAPGPRETHIPAPTPAPATSATCSEAGRIEAIETRMEADGMRAQAFREQVIGQLAELKTMIAERTRRGAGPAKGGDRETT